MAERLPDEAALKHSQPNGAGLSGLVNMDQGLNNVCYQNSLIQALFMTSDFKRAAVALPLLPRTTDDAVVDGGVSLGSWRDLVTDVCATPEEAVERLAAAVKDAAAAAPGDDAEAAPALADGEVPHGGESESKGAEPVDEEWMPIGDAPGCMPGDVGNRVQWLLASLALSQRPALASHALQGVLPPSFRTGRQQDIAEFRTFLMESLSQAYPGKTNAALMDDLFGCDLVTATRCYNCNHRTLRSEQTTQVNVSFPTKFTAITDIRIVTVPRPMGKMPTVETPAGYTRINFDLNKDRADSP